MIEPVDWINTAVLAFVMACIVAYLRKQNRINTCQAIAFVLFVSYVFLVFCSTVFSRPYTGVHAYRRSPFWS